jgi:hypothetical protein
MRLFISAFLCVLSLLLLVVLPAACYVLYSVLRKPAKSATPPLHRPRWRLLPSPNRQRVLLLTYGTRGDVQPVVALAVALRAR